MDTSSVPTSDVSKSPSKSHHQKSSITNRFLSIFSSVSSPTKAIKKQISEIKVPTLPSQILSSRHVHYTRPSVILNPCLLINKILCTNLKKVELFGSKNDVYLTFSWRDAFDKTERIDNAGDRAMFHDPLIRLRPNVNEDINNKLYIKVYDYNTATSDQIIGEAEIEINKTLPGSTWTETVQLKDKHGRPSGDVKLKLKLQDVPWDDVDEYMLADRNSSLFGFSKPMMHLANRHKTTSEVYEAQNNYITITFLSSFIVWFLFVCTRVTKYFLGHLKPHEPVFISSTLQCLLYFIVILFMMHRLLACILGMGLRMYLTKSLRNNGKFDIHIGWASIRGLVDTVEVVLHHVVLRNPVGFNQTPYVLFIKKIHFVFPTTSLLQFLWHRHVLKLDEVCVYTVELFAERAPEGTTGLSFDINIFEAITVPSKTKNDSKKDDIKINDVKTNDIKNDDIKKDDIKSDTKVESEQVIADDTSTAPNLNTHRNHSDSIAQGPQHSESRYFADHISSLLWHLVVKVEEKFSFNPLRKAESKKEASQSNHDDGWGSDTEENIHNNSDGNSNNKEATTTQKQVSTGKSDIYLDIGQLILTDVTLHVLDFLSERHLDPTPASDVIIDILHFDRHLLTDKPKRKGADRTPITIHHFLKKITDPLVSKLLAHNATSIPTLLAKLSASKSLSMVFEGTNLAVSAGSTAVHAAANVGASAATVVTFGMIGRKKEHNKVN